MNTDDRNHSTSLDEYLSIVEGVVNDIFEIPCSAKDAFVKNALMKKIEMMCKERFNAEADAKNNKNNDVPNRDEYIGKDKRLLFLLRACTATTKRLVNNGEYEVVSNAIETKELIKATNELKYDALFELCNRILEKLDERVYKMLKESEYTTLVIE